MVSFRRAQPSDCDLYYAWTQEPGTREFSYTQNTIQHSEHVNWFKQKLKDENSLLLVALENEQPCGQIRFDLQGEVATLSFSVAAAFRGKGYAKALLTAGAVECRKHFGKELKIIGEVISANEASVRAFRSSGYLPIAQFERAGHPSLRFQAP